VSHPAVADALRSEQYSIPAGHAARRTAAIGFAVGGLGLIAWLALAAAQPKQAAFSWLVAFLYFSSLALGALFFVLIHFSMQGGWGIVVRRLAENAMATMPLFALLFVPVLVLRHELYPWLAESASSSHLLHGKAPYLNLSFFAIRAAVALGCWSAIAVLYFRASRRQDRTGDTALSVAMRRFSGPAIVLVALTQTFAAIDWIMSLEPEWYSTMFGVYWFSGALVTFFALLALIVVGLRRVGLLVDVVGVEHFHDLGKLMFAFTVFWAYIGFSQFFLIWYGNIPEETIFFRERLAGSWHAASFLLAAGHFVVPFFFLMPRTIKRRPGPLAAGAAWLLLMHLVDVYWLVMPVLHPEGIRIGLLDVAAWVAVGGLFVGTFGRLAAGAPLIPIRDPRLPESMRFENF
jgi:hypothetical protein